MSMIPRPPPFKHEYTPILSGEIYQRQNELSWLLVCNKTIESIKSHIVTLTSLEKRMLIYVLDLFDGGWGVGGGPPPLESATGISYL
jgi:hypothetical protein